MKDKEPKQDNHTTYVRQLSNTAMNMRKSLEKEFSEKLSNMDLKEADLELMKQETMKRIQHLKDERLKRSNSIASGGASAKNNGSFNLSRLNS